MVVGARPLDLLQVLLEVLGREERRSIHAREHWVVRVPAPVGACHRLEPERLDPLGARRVGPATEIGERAVRVERDGAHALVLDEILDQLDLVVLALGQEALERLAGGHLLADERLVGLDVLAHLRLDPLEVGVADRGAFGKVEVVVEAVLDRGPDRDLHARIELHHRLREHVCAVVADQGESLGSAAIGEDLEAWHTVASRKLPSQVAHLPVDLDRQRRPRQSRSDRRGRVGPGRALRQRQLVAIGKLKLHGRRMLSVRLPGATRGPAGQRPRLRTRKLNCPISIVCGPTWRSGLDARAPSSGQSRGPDVLITGQTMSACRGGGHPQVGGVMTSSTWPRNTPPAHQRPWPLCGAQLDMGHRARHGLAHGHRNRRVAPSRTGPHVRRDDVGDPRR